MQDTAQQCPNCGYSFFAQPQNGTQGARQVRFATGASAPQGPFYMQPTPPTAMQTGNVPYGAAPSVKRARKVPLWVKIGAPILAAVVLVVGLVSVFFDNGTAPTVSYAMTEDNESTSKIDLLPVTGQVYSQTIMIYMVGSDLETECGAATADMREMLNATVDTEKHNILVYTGGTTQWQVEGIPNDGNVVYQLTENGFEAASASDTCLNMGETKTLADFIAYGLSNYVTDKYGLILWDHGGGPNGGYGFDEIYNDALSLKEMQDALQTGTQAAGKTFEWIGFDACLMSSLEVASAFAPYASYLIASQEAEPAYGWDYSFLDALSQADMDGARLGKTIIDHYMAFYREAFANGLPQTDIMLSCIDLQKVETVNHSLDALFAEVDAAVLNDGFSGVARARNNTKAFGQFTGGTQGYDLVDLQHLLMQLGETYPEAQMTKEAVSDMIMYTATNANNTYGISVYCPYGNMEEAGEILPEYDNIGFSKSYTAFVHDFYNIRLKGTANTDMTKSKLGSSTQKGNVNFTLQLTETQTETYASAAYYILQKDTEATDTYTFVFGSNNVSLNGNTVTASFNNRAIYAFDGETGEMGSMPIQLLETEQIADDLRLYQASAVLQYVGTDAEGNFRFDVNTARLQFVLDEKTGELSLRKAMPSTATGAFAGKQELSIYEYDTMEFVGSVRRLTRDENGTSLDFYSWEDTGTAAGTGIRLATGYLQLHEIPDRQNYFCQFIVTDIYGNKSASELIPMQ